jgi:hypothetical protein
MNSKALITGFLIITFSSAVFGQKIKYKDLFVLLNAKSPDAEPYLKKYLKLNDDNPNAYLFMGMIFQEKAAKQDVLKQTDEALVQFDSAVYFFDKSSQIMTEKEVSKNKDYYQMYSRRDMRTGEFGVKFSDVKLDIETRTKDIKERSAKIKVLKSSFVAAEKYYKNSQNAFLAIQKAYPGLKELYLRADDSLHTKLIHLTAVFDSCRTSFTDYKTTLEELGKTGYNQDLDFVEIADLKKDGTTAADFYRDDLKVWDYRRWALSNMEVIEKDINPAREQLVAVDFEINQAQQKLKKDSVSVRDEVAVIRKKIDFASLKKIDPNPLPVRVFNMKLSELEYGSQIVVNKPLRDSLNVFLRLETLKGELMLIKKIDSLSGVLADRNLEDEMKNYKNFVTTSYGTPDVLNSLISATKSFSVREAQRKENEIKNSMASLRWIIDGADSIPLFMEVNPRSRFKPLLLQPEKFTAGIQYVDSVATGYFYTISNTRRPQVKVPYPVDQQAFRKRNLALTKALVTHDEKGLVFFIVFYSEVKVKDKFPATIVKIYRHEGLAWSINYGFTQLPAEIVFSSETFELTIKTKSSIGEVFPVIFDKAGKVVK